MGMGRPEEAYIDRAVPGSDFQLPPWLAEARERDAERIKALKIGSVTGSFELYEEVCERQAAQALTEDDRIETDG